MTDNPTRTLANGTVVDAQTGKIITAPPVPPFSRPEVRAKAAEARRRKRAMVENRVLKGLCEAAIAAGKMSADTPLPKAPGEMVQAVASTLGKAIFDPGEELKARESVRKDLFQDAGLTPRAYEREDGGGHGDRITIDLSPDTAAALVGAAAQLAVNRANRDADG